MKLMVIAPPNALSVLTTMRLSAHLVLAQHVQDPIYRAFYQSAQRRGAFIMLDNGAGELGRSLPIADLVEAANEVHADEITLPDVLGDADATLSATRAAMPAVPRKARAVCPHGTTWDEWEACAYAMVQWGCATICIGRYDNLPGGRIPALAIILKNNWQWTHHIHLFGCSEPPLAETRRELAAAPWIRSMDTGAAVAFAQEDCLINDGAGHASLKWGAPFNSRYTEQNIDLLLDICNGERPCMLH
jgi:hypothetical protein